MTYDYLIFPIDTVLISPDQSNNPLFYGARRNETAGLHNTDREISSGSGMFTVIYFLKKQNNGIFVYAVFLVPCHFTGIQSVVELVGGKYV